MIVVTAKTKNMKYNYTQSTTVKCTWDKIHTYSAHAHNFISRWEMYYIDWGYDDEEINDKLEFFFEELIDINIAQEKITDYINKNYPTIEFTMKEIEGMLYAVQKHHRRSFCTEWFFCPEWHNQYPICTKVDERFYRLCLWVENGEVVEGFV